MVYDVTYYTLYSTLLYNILHPVCCLRSVSDWTQPLDILSADSELVCYYLSTKGCLGNPTLGTNLGQRILAMRTGCMTSGRCCEWAKKTIHTLIHTHIHTYIYIYIYTHTYIGLAYLFYTFVLPTALGMGTGTPSSHSKNSLSKICSEGWVAQRPFC